MCPNVKEKVFCQKCNNEVLGTFGNQILKEKDKIFCENLKSLHLAMQNPHLRGSLVQTPISYLKILSTKNEF